MNFGEWDYDLLANTWDSDLLVEWGVDLPIDNEYNPTNKEKEIDEQETENECPSCGYKW